MRRTVLGLALLMLMPGAAVGAIPTITATVDGTRGTNGWYVSPVVIHWTVSSDATSSDCQAVVSVPDDTAGTTRGCSASNSDGTASASVPLKIDKTPPVAGAAAFAAAARLGLDGSTIRSASPGRAPTRSRASPAAPPPPTRAPTTPPPR